MFLKFCCSVVPTSMDSSQIKTCKTGMHPFESWCKSASLSASSDQGLVDALRRYATHCEDMGIGDRAFLKAAVFRMLQSQCQQGNQRLIDLLKDVMTDRSS